MSIKKCVVFITGIFLLFSTGCALNRANITKLSEAQQRYYCCSNFFENEFKQPLTVGKLCEVINHDCYNIPLKSPNNTIAWLNEILEVSNFYDILHAKKPDIKFSNSVEYYITETKDYRDKKYSDSSEEQQKNIKRLNRLLLEETYQQDTPKSYGGLLTYLKENKQQLEDALDIQLKADEIRKRHLLDWERKLKQAEVLLQVGTNNVDGNQRLLSMKLAEINLGEIVNLYDIQIDDAREEAILQLYDKLIDAIVLLEKNNNTIVEYLSSSNAEFVLRSFDVEGAVRTISAIRSLQEELGQIKKRSEEEQKKESERIQKSMEHARDVLIKVYTKN